MLVDTVCNCAFLIFVRNNFISDFTDHKTKQFCKMVLSNKNRYTEEQKDMICNLKYRSTSTYKFLREDFKLHLPSIRTIYTYNCIKRMKPGFCEEIFEHLKALAENMSLSDRQVGLLYDEVSIRRDFVYNDSTRDIDGTEDFGKSLLNALNTITLG